MQLYNAELQCYSYENCSNISSSKGEFALTRRVTLCSSSEVASHYNTVGKGQLTTKELC